MSCPSAGPCRGNRILQLVPGGNCASRGLKPYQSLICCMKPLNQHLFAWSVLLAMVFILVVPSHHRKCLFLIFVPAFDYLLAMHFSLVYPNLLLSHALTHTLTADCVPSWYCCLGTSSFSPGQISTWLYFDQCSIILPHPAYPSLVPRIMTSSKRQGCPLHISRSVPDLFFYCFLLNWPSSRLYFSLSFLTYANSPHHLQ